MKGYICTIVKFMIYQKWILKRDWNLAFTDVLKKVPGDF